MRMLFPLCLWALNAVAAPTLLVHWPLDEAKADAKYEDGILSLTLPKKVSAPDKRLKVQ